MNGRGFIGSLSGIAISSGVPAVLIPFLSSARLSAFVAFPSDAKMLLLAVDGKSEGQLGFG